MQRLVEFPRPPHLFYRPNRVAHLSIRSLRPGIPYTLLFGNDKIQNKKLEKMLNKKRKERNNNNTKRHNLPEADHDCTTQCTALHGTWEGGRQAGTLSHTTLPSISPYKVLSSFSSVVSSCCIKQSIICSSLTTRCSSILLVFTLYSIPLPVS